MKKHYSLATAITAIVVSGTVSADPLTWSLFSDNVLDGTLTYATESTVVGRIFTNHFYLENTVDSSDSVTLGNIESESLDVGAGTQARINFTTYRNGDSLEYSGHAIGNGQYQGVWYSGNGNSGDFLLDTNEVNTSTPFEPSSAILIPSTQYGQHPATAVFDGVLGDNNGNVWIGLPDDPGAALTIQLAEPRSFTKYGLSRGYCAAYGYVAGTWKLYGSNDNVNYIQIDDVSEDQGSIMSCTSLTEFTVDAPSSYMFYKFEFEMSSVNTYTHTGVAIGELTLQE